jgi:hypothetical protein
MGNKEMASGTWESVSVGLSNNKPPKRDN